MNATNRWLESRFPDRREEIRLLVCTLQYMHLSVQNVQFMDGVGYIIMPEGKTEIDPSFWDGFNKAEGYLARVAFIRARCAGTALPQESMFSFVSRLGNFFRARARLR